MTSAIEIPRPEHDEDEVVEINVPRWRAGVGVVMLLLFVGYLIEAFSLVRGTLSSPGPGLFPIIVGAGGLIAAGLVVVEALRASTTTATLPKGKQAKEAIFFIVGLIIAVLLLPILGMFIVGPLYAAITAWVLADKHRWRGALISAVLVFGACLAFTELLEVRLPMGIW